MSVSGKYEKITYIASGGKVSAQSIVECRLNDWAEYNVLAVSARAVFGGAEVQSGEIRYGGRVYFTVLAATPRAASSAGNGARNSPTAPNAKARRPRRRQTSASAWKRRKCGATAGRSSFRLF